MNKISYLISIIILASFSNAYATDDEVITVSCKKTPAIWQMKTSPNINSTNNLRRPKGLAEFAKGEFINIRGRILDSNCVPVEGAIVEIWHANYLGIAQYETEDYKDIDPYFIDSGRAITNNQGYYDFFSIMPGTKSKNPPHINFRVRHRDFMVFESVMFFDNQSLNSKDALIFNEVPEVERYLLVAKGEKINKNSIEEGITYRFDITLEGKNKYLTY